MPEKGNRRVMRHPGKMGQCTGAGFEERGREKGKGKRESAWSFEGERPGLYRCNGRVEAARGRW